jgi:hypothetical protein
MGEKKTNPITIDGKEYVYEDLTQEQRVLFDHCIDLDRKISNTAFQLDQLNVGKNAFFNLLKESLAKPVEQAEVEVVETVQ